ncbi:MAG: hypothetical protein LBC42_00915 [Puniceicoccales bacterium]|jgi:hypothetical protein|nr:hypothetical protein [Puniceicoccales bacterium]
MNPIVPFKNVTFENATSTAEALWPHVIDRPNLLRGAVILFEARTIAVCVALLLGNGDRENPILRTFRALEAGYDRTEFLRFCLSTKSLVDSTYGSMLVKDKDGRAYASVNEHWDEIELTLPTVCQLLAATTYGISETLPPPVINAMQLFVKGNNSERACIASAIDWLYLKSLKESELPLQVLSPLPQ